MYLSTDLFILDGNNVFLATLKGTVQQDGRGYESGINPLKQWTPQHISIFIKGTVSNLHLKCSAPKQHLARQRAGHFPSAGFFSLPTWKYVLL